MNPNTIIPQSDDRLLAYFLKNVTVGLFTQQKSSNEDDKLLYSLLGLITIVATEPFKVLLRKNIGKLSLSFPRLAVAAILYLFWASIIYGVSVGSRYDEFSDALLAGCVFYVLFAIILLVIGSKEYSIGKQNYLDNEEDKITHLYRGDSIYFKGEDQKKIWLVKEPAVCFGISLLLTVLPAFVDPILLMVGAPLLATSISFWFNEWFQISNVWDIQTRKIQLAQLKNEKEQGGFETEDFNTVSTD